MVTRVDDLSTYAEKWAAERAAQRVAGVKALATSLKVQLAGPRRHGDADIAHAAENLLGVTGVTDRIVLKPAVAPEAVRADIEVAVDGGDVTLRGRVHSWHERNAATHSAWGTPGVRNVIDHLQLVP